MADKLKANAVEVRNHPGIEGHFLLSLAPQLIFLDGQHAHQHVIEVHADMRKRRNQRRRGRVVQLQAGIAGDAVTAQGELNLLGTVDAQQQGVGRAAQLLEGARDGPAWQRVGTLRDHRFTLRCRAAGWQGQRGSHQVAGEGHQREAGENIFFGESTHDLLTGREIRGVDALGMRGKKLPSHCSTRTKGRARWRSHAGRY